VQRRACRLVGKVPLVPGGPGRRSLLFSIDSICVSTHARAYSLSLSLSLSLTHTHTHTICAVPRGLAGLHPFDLRQHAVKGGSSVQCAGAR
jgi:hypothetical protein